jgi:hypothetical protein
MQQTPSDVNKLIIQMLLQNPQNDNRVSRVDRDIDWNYRKGFELLPPSPSGFSPSYHQPFRQRDPQIEQWLRSLGS